VSERSHGENDPAGEVTIDELAQEAGIPTSTVRMYQNRGLLPPPQRRGRVGYYQQNHRDRLRLIAHLGERGFSLSAIKEALDAWSSGMSLDHLLGLAEVAPGFTREPLRLAPDEFAAMFSGIELTQADMIRAVEVGLIEFDGSDIVIAHPAFADIGPSVARIGVPVAEILDEYAALREAVTAITERFRTVFDRHVWARFEEAGMRTEGIARLTSDAARLSALATAVVTTELHLRFAEFVATYVERAEAVIAHDPMHGTEPPSTGDHTNTADSCSKAQSI
jgi:DNA-binding transcriptional MerR regulator